MTPSELLRNLTAMRDRANDLSPVLKAIGDLMVASADRNFEAQGRPAWAPVQPATAKRKTKAGHGKILMWSGNLARSIAFVVKGKSVVVGTNVPYARIHNEGGVIERYARSTWATARRTDAAGMGRFARTKGARAHKSAIHEVFTIGAYQIPMPARPFLMFQPGETESYGGIVMQFVLTGRISQGGQP